MSLINAYQITHAFGADDLFIDLNARVEPKERIGLVGPNGSGKTTLLRMLAGRMTPQKGQIHRQKELTMGYLRQEAVLTFAGRDNTIYEEMLSVFADLTGLEKKMRQMEQRMTAGESDQSLFDAYSLAQTKYEAGGGYDYQVAIKRVLDGLGFPPETWEMPLDQLSGGQKTRVLLARLLLEAPDVLILDEPTNHLDASAVEWLERTLRNWSGTLLIVSHDRYFLDRVVNRIWELTAAGLSTYSGNYTSFVAQRQQQWEHARKLFDSEIGRMEKELDFIRKHIAGGKTDMAKGKLKRLARDIVAIEEVGVVAKDNKSWLEIGGRVNTFSANEAAKRLAGLEPPDSRPPRLNIRLNTAVRSDDLVLKTQRLQIGYPDTFLFKTDKIRLEYLDCAALIGPNGSGKTTLLKTLLGEIEPLKGKITYGDNVRIGYFAQAHEQLDPARTALETVMHGRTLVEQEARRHLAQYLFRGHDVFKKVGALSGGERGRLALSLLALEGANLLLLDEPTNHLDIPSQEILQEVLERFDGTILLVSHDRYLIDALATQIWEIRTDEQKLHIFDGTYGEYLGLEAPTDPLAIPPQKPADGRGQKATQRKETESAPAPDLSWVQELTAVPDPTPRKKRRHLADIELQIERAQAYLDTLYAELETAELAGDLDEIEFLEEEIDAAQIELDELEAEL